MPCRNHLALSSQPNQFDFKRACRTLFGISLLIQLSGESLSTIFIFLCYFSCFLLSAYSARGWLIYAFSGSKSNIVVLLESAPDETHTFCWLLSSIASFEKIC